MSDPPVTQQKTTERRTAADLVGAWLLAVLLLVGGWAARDSAQGLDELVHSGARVNAEVIGVHRYHSGGKDGSWEYRAEVRFTAADGQEVLGETKIDKPLHDRLADRGERQEGGPLSRRVVHRLAQASERIPVVHAIGDPRRFMHEDPGEAQDSTVIVGWIMTALGLLTAFFAARMTYQYARRTGRRATTGRSAGSSKR